MKTAVLILSLLVIGASAHARDQVLSCNFNKPKDQKYFTGSSRIEKRNPALKLNVDRAEMYPSKNLNTIHDIELKRVSLENFVLITGDEGQTRVKYMIPNEILGENLDDVKIHLEVYWRGDDSNGGQWFTLNCDSRVN